MAEQYHLIFIEPLPRIFDDFNSILHESIDCHIRRGLTIAAERLPRAALIPLDDREIFLPSAIRGQQRRVRHSWPAVENNNRRIFPVLPADTDPLADTPDPNESILSDC